MDTKKLRQKILDLAIHGKLVPQDPNDEPASVLLERIRAEKERLISEGKMKRSRKTAKTTDTHHYESVPFEVPKGWAFGYGKDLFAPMQSIKPSSDTFYYADIESVDNTTNTLSAKIIKKEFAPSRASRYCEKGDLLFSMVRPYLKNIAMVNISNCIASTGFYICHSNGSLDKDYLFRMMLSDYVVNGLNTYMKGDNSPSINKINIDTFLFPVPPLAEQKRIMAEINRWFALIDTIEQGKENLEISIKQAKSKILDLAIHGKLVPQDPSDEPASELLKRINPKAQITCDNEHYTQLPKGWSIISMQDICKLKDGIKQDNIPLINLDVKYLRGVSEGNTIRSGRFVSANSYMILVDGENSGEIFKAPIDGYQGSTFKLLDIDQNIDEKYILNVINLHRKALRENKVGSAIPHLNKKLFKAISVPLPPYNEQVRIVEAIKPTFNLLDALKENL